MIVPLSHPGDLGSLDTQVVQLDRPVTLERFVPMVAVAPTGIATFRIRGEDGNTIAATVPAGQTVGFAGTGSTRGKRFELETVADAGARWFRGYAESTLRTGRRYFAPLIYPGTLGQNDVFAFSLAPYSGRVRRLLPAVAHAPELADLTLRLKTSSGTTDPQRYTEATIGLGSLTGDPGRNRVPVAATALLWLEAASSDGTGRYSRGLAEIMLDTPFIGALRAVPVYHPGIIEDGDSILIRGPGVATTLRHFIGNFGVDHPGANLQLTAEVEGTPGTTLDLTLLDWRNHGSQGGSALTVPADSDIRIRFLDLNGRQDYFRGLLVFEAEGETPAADIGLVARVLANPVLDAQPEMQALLDSTFRAETVLDGTVYVRGDVVRG